MPIGSAYDDTPRRLGVRGQPIVPVEHEQLVPIRAAVGSRLPPLRLQGGRLPPAEGTELPLGVRTPTLELPHARLKASHNVNQAPHRNFHDFDLRLALTKQFVQPVDELPSVCRVGRQMHIDWLRHLSSFYT
jgi:hypothetical protein